jgi:hypothetical protein
MVSKLTSSPAFWAIIISAVMYFLLPKDKLFAWFDQITGAEK